MVTYIWVVNGWYQSKNKHQKDMCWKEIGLRAQKLLTILDAIVNISGEGPIWSYNISKNLQFKIE